MDLCRLEGIEAAKSFFHDVVVRWMLIENGSGLRTLPDQVLENINRWCVSWSELDWTEGGTTTRWSWSTTTSAAEESDLPPKQVYQLRMSDEEGSMKRSNCSAGITRLMMMMTM